ncbi:GxxExxY protein [Belliella baltica]|uniref:GxxExxY protein n=1 Tax=Belliella baltica TaxID=232259 RepID=UPI0002DF76C8|nr:GxxExxY protein [Belliella baltica]
MDINEKSYLIRKACFNVHNILAPVHSKQVLTYLKIAKKELGFLVNFNSKSLDKYNLIRIINSK